MRRFIKHLTFLLVSHEPPGADEKHFFSWFPSSRQASTNKSPTAATLGKKSSGVHVKSMWWSKLRFVNVKRSSWWLHVETRGRLSCKVWSLCIWSLHCVFLSAPERRISNCINWQCDHVCSINYKTECKHITVRRPVHYVSKGRIVGQGN